MMAYLLVYLAKLDIPLRFLSVLLEADVLCKTGCNNFFLMNTASTTNKIAAPQIKYCCTKFQ